MDLSKISNIVVGGIDIKDYPEFSDSFIESAYYNSRPMTEIELDKLNSDYPDFVYEKVVESLY